MLRFLVFADTHGVRQPMRDLYRKYPNDGIIHLGDYIADSRWMKERTLGHPVYGVRGNCDYGDTGPEEQILELGGAKILICHGHRYGVKSGMGELIARAKSLGVQAVLYGHTHAPYLQEREGILVMNPGALSSLFRYYGIIEIENQQVKGVLLRQHE